MSIAKLVRWVLGAAVVAGSIGAPATASAARSITLRIEVDQNLALTGTLTTTGTGSTLKRCAITGPHGISTADVTGSKKQTIGPFSADGEQPGAELLRLALEGREVRCGESQWPTSTWESVDLDPTLVLPKTQTKLTPSVPVFAPDYSWILGDTLWGRAILRAFGAPQGCKAWNGDKEIGCSLNQGGGTLRFAIADKVTSGKVLLLSEDKQKKWEITIPIDACKFELNGDLPALVPGSTQRILIRRESENRACSFQIDKATKLALGDKEISLSRVSRRQWAGSPEVEFQTSRIPDVAAGSIKAELRSPSGMLGIVNVDVVPPIETKGKLHVQYDLKQIQDRYGRFEVASGESSDSTAVVNPLADVKPPAARKPWLVLNQIDVFVPSPLAKSPADAASIIAGHEKAALEELNGMDVTGAELTDSALVWTVETGPVASGGVSFRDCEVKDELGKTRCVLKAGLDELQFEVGAPSTRPLRPVFSLVRLRSWTVERFVQPAPGAAPGTPGTREEKVVWTQDELLRVPVQIAASAVRESVPLPVRDLLRIKCEREAPIKANHTRAIDDEAVRQGKCQIVLDPQGLEKDDLKLYGPQILRVTVQRNGTEKAEAEWMFSPSADATPAIAGVKPSNKWPDNLTLRAPPADDKGSGVYTVDAQVSVKPSTDVHYRGATLERLQAKEGLIEHSDLHFRAQLRPRGLFGWSCRRGDSQDTPGSKVEEKSKVEKKSKVEEESTGTPFCGRSYVTVGTQLGGVRFPAALRELRNTSQPTEYQFVSPRVGLLLALEPWNYDEGVNPWVLNPAFQVGAHFLNLADGSIQMSSLVGIAATLPLVSDSSSQLGTKLTAGVFWEHDFQGGDHLLVNIGLNIGSLFSGTQKQ